MMAKNVLIKSIEVLSMMAKNSVDLTTTHSLQHHGKEFLLIKSTEVLHILCHECTSVDLINNSILCHDAMNTSVDLTTHSLP